MHDGRQHGPAFQSRSTICIPIVFLLIIHSARAFITKHGHRPSTRVFAEEAEGEASRRAALTRIVAALPASPALAAEAAARAPAEHVVRTPLEYVTTLNAYVVHYYLFGERFGAIVDTGSPFLTAPSTCRTRSYKYLWGCYRPERTSDSGYPDTYVALDNNLGVVAWRKAGFAFDAVGSVPEQRELVFGVFGPALLDGPGGVFLGLIRDTDARIYPSFLGQTGYDSFRVDLRRPGDGARGSGPELVLSTAPLIREDYIPLVRDLNRRYKASVCHYAAIASRFEVNGVPLASSTTKPIYVIFDSGCSGMSVSEELFERRNLQARRNREKSLWGKVAVAFATREGREVRLEATQPLTTAVDNRTLSRYRGPIVVMGLAFLDGLAMTIDAGKGKLLFSR